MVERINTGIPGFDKMVQGGIPKGYTVLLSGSPGSCKTIFGLQYLANGAQNDEPGLFISFEETATNLINQAACFGIDLKKLHRENKVILKPFPRSELMSEQILMDTIKKILSAHKIKRIVIDSLNAFVNNVIAFEESDCKVSDTFRIKRAIYRIMMDLHDFGTITKIVISEADEGSSSLSRDGESEFLADGIIKINYSTMGGEYDRHITVRKMRSTLVDSRLLPITVTKRGLVINPQNE